LLGKDGCKVKDGISPTEREFDCAVESHKIKLIFITNHKNEENLQKNKQVL
jgi:hypothetical protein